MLHSICPTNYQAGGVFCGLGFGVAECGGEICKNDGIDRVALAQGLPGTACLGKPQLRNPEANPEATRQAQQPITLNPKP